MTQLSSDMELFKNTSQKKIKPALPVLKSANICKYVESTVMSQYSSVKPANTEQLATVLAVRNLIAACISYITAFQPPEKHKWEYVYAMLASGTDETYLAPVGTPLDALFRNIAIDNPDCLAWALYQSAAEGKAGHFADILSKALLMTLDYVFFT